MLIFLSFATPQPKCYTHPMLLHIKNILTFLAMDHAKNTAKLPLSSTDMTTLNTATLERAWWGWTFRFLWCTFFARVIIFFLWVIEHFSCDFWRWTFIVCVCLYLSLSLSLCLFLSFLHQWKWLRFCFWLFISQNLISYTIILLITTKWA